MIFCFLFFRDGRLCFLLFVFLGVRGFVFSRDERQRLCFLLFVFLGMKGFVFFGVERLCFFAFCFFKDEMLCICFF